MLNTEKNCFDANNSNIQTTPGSEKANNVQILFGLTPKKIYKLFDSYFDCSSGCGLALLELLEEIQQRNDQLVDASVEIAFTKTVRVLADFERLRDDYSKIYATFGFSNDDPQWLSAITEPEEWKAVQNLHNGFIHVIRGLESVGLPDFSFDTAGSMQYIKTKSAYEGMTLALASVLMLYVEYIKSCHATRAQQCLTASKH